MAAMALNSINISASLHPMPKPCGPTIQFLNPKHGTNNHRLLNLKLLHYSSVVSALRTSATAQPQGAPPPQPQGGGGGVTEEEEDPPPYSAPGSFSSTRARLDLLEQLTSTSSTVVDGYESSSEVSTGKLTIRDQLARLAENYQNIEEDFSIQLGKDNLKKVSPKFLTVSQKRNIKRQAYLNEVSQRNDTVFFATIGAFVLLPPLVILAVSVLTGYVQLFP